MKSNNDFTAAYGEHAKHLSLELQQKLESLLAYRPGVAVSTVSSAVSDFHDLETILNGPGASDVINDVSLLGEAEALLADLLSRAVDVAVLANVAGDSSDREAREAAGDAILALQDQHQILRKLTLAVLRWASTQSDEDLEHYQHCVQRLNAETRTFTKR